MTMAANRCEKTRSIDDVDAAVLERKVWWRVLPFVVILFVISILDRVNVGYAALTMNPYLGSIPPSPGFISGIFFVSYVIFDEPSNQFQVWKGARIWLFRMMVSWELIMVLIAFVQIPVSLAFSVSS